MSPAEVYQYKLEPKLAVEAAKQASMAVRAAFWASLASGVFCGRCPGKDGSQRLGAPDAMCGKKSGGFLLFTESHPQMDSCYLLSRFSGGSGANRTLVCRFG